MNFDDLKPALDKLHHDILRIWHSIEVEETKLLLELEALRNEINKHEEENKHLQKCIVQIIKEVWEEMPERWRENHLTIA